jgi:hypothetical protein
VNITHKAIRAENDTTHGPKTLIKTGDGQWCPICHSWTQPPIDQAFVAQLAPKIAHFLKHGHEKGGPK